MLIAESSQLEPVIVQDADGSCQGMREAVVSPFAIAASMSDVVIDAATTGQ